MTEKEFLLSEIRKWREEMKQGKDMFDDYNDKVDFYIKAKLNLLDQITALLTDEQKKELKEMLKNVLSPLLGDIEGEWEKKMKQVQDKLITVLDKTEEYLTE